MNKPISTGAHGVIDYVTAGTLLTLPGILGLSPRLTRAMQMVGLGKLIYSMLTQHEMGIVKLIPMKAHLTLDAVGGATLAALPYLLDERDETAMAACVTLGLMDMSASVITETQPSDDSMIPDVGQKVRRAIKGSSNRRRASAGAR